MTKLLKRIKNQGNYFFRQQILQYSFSFINFLMQLSFHFPKKFDKFFLFQQTISKEYKKNQFIKPYYKMHMQTPPSSQALHRIQLSPDKIHYIETLQSIKGQQIISCSVSANRKFMLITSEMGFLIVNISTSTTFKRFQNQKSPFFVNESIPHGIKQGFIFQQKPEVALIPNFISKKYKNTSIYIYNYSAKIILTSFDFVLPIKQFTLTDRFLICSNNKRILVYNYIKYKLEDREQFYIDTHNSNNNIDFIRYLDLNCHLYHEQFPQKCINCQCGTFQFTYQYKKYLKIFFVKIQLNRSSNHKNLYVYDEITDKVKPFETIKTVSDDFQFKISQNKKYLLIADDYSRKIKVFNLDNNQLTSVLHLGRVTARVISFGIISHPQRGQLVVTARQKEDDLATMHIFQLKKTQPSQQVQSKYKRYFRLYKRDTIKKNVFANNVQFVDPEYYMIQGKLMCLSMEGQECELIDLNRTGLHDRANASSYSRIEEKK